MKPINDLSRALKRKVHSIMAPGNNVPRIFYCHVPKCAGSAVAESIRKRMFYNYKSATFEIDLEASKNASQVSSLEMMKVREIVLAYNLSMPKYYFGAGHVYCRPDLVDFYIKKWNFVTLLRNPVDRWISEYVYNTFKNEDWAKNTLPIEDYIESEKGKNSGGSFIRYFSSMPDDYAGSTDVFVDEAVANLGRFSVIGTIENIDGWCESFNARFGKHIAIPRGNASPNTEAADRIRSSDALVRKIAMLCEPDIHIYQRIVEQTTEKVVRVSRR